MPKLKKPAPSEWALYGGCVICGAPFLVHEHANPKLAPVVMPSCTCTPMLAFAAQLNGVHVHHEYDS